MDILETILYIILTIVIITLIIVLGWLYYDYNNFKDDLNSNFSYLDSKLKTQKRLNNKIKNDIIDNDERVVIVKGGVDELKGDVYDTEDDEGIDVDGIKSKVKINNDNITDIKSFIGKEKNLDSGEDATGFHKVKEYVGKPSGANSVSTGLHHEIKTNYEEKALFNENLNKYFVFGTDDVGLNGPSVATDGVVIKPDMWNYNIGNNSNDSDGKLKLIHETTVAANMTIKGAHNSSSGESTPNKILKICDNEGSVCYRIFVDANKNLSIQQDLANTDNEKKFILGNYSIPAAVNTDTTINPTSLSGQIHNHEYDSLDSDGETTTINTGFGQYS
tara:strand:- start:4064 stop:5059 length:996 start_codon:yes stop_codon:yes gene_type:complete